MKKMLECLARVLVLLGFLLASLLFVPALVLLAVSILASVALMLPGVLLWALVRRTGRQEAIIDADAAY